MRRSTPQAREAPAPDGLAERADARQREGHTVMLIAVDGKAAGLLGVADPIRESTLEAVRRLREEGLELIAGRVHFGTRFFGPHL